MSSPRLTPLLHRVVRFGEVSYDFCISAGLDSWNELRRRLAALDADRFLLIADAGLHSSAIAQVELHLQQLAPTVVVTTPASEVNKRLSTIEELADRAILSNVTRQSCVVALGGGVVCNMAGLLAALLYRGIRLIHLPTTLLGMSDSSLSLKQAVNSRNGKNHFGTFYPPVLVWNHIDFLDSLPPEEIQAALCEAIKNVVGICPDRYDDVARKLRSDGRYSPEEIVDFIELCIDAKTSVMCNDPLEKHDALILEYGHTVGHAVELIKGGKFRHGFAVGVGMLAAARISRLLGYLDSSDEEKHRELLQRNGAPTVVPNPPELKQIMEIIRLDNKRGYVRTRAGMCDFVLLDQLGKAHRGEAGLITQVEDEVVRAGIESILSY